MNIYIYICIYIYIYIINIFIYIYVHYYKFLLNGLILDLFSTQHNHKHRHQYHRHRHRKRSQQRQLLMHKQAPISSANNININLTQNQITLVTNKSNTRRNIIKYRPDDISSVILNQLHDSINATTNNNTNNIKKLKPYSYYTYKSIFNITNSTENFNILNSAKPSLDKGNLKDLNNSANVNTDLKLQKKKDKSLVFSKTNINTSAKRLESTTNSSNTLSIANTKDENKNYSTNSSSIINKTKNYNKNKKEPSNITINENIGVHYNSRKMRPSASKFLNFAYENLHDIENTNLLTYIDNFIRSSNHLKSNGSFDTVESGVKRDKVFKKFREKSVDRVLNKISSNSSNTKAVLFCAAVNELKKVLNKQNLSPEAKSRMLSKIFDDKGDLKKASLTNEIFREVLAPSKPTHGSVGDLGAQMIKVSVLSRHRKGNKSKKFPQKMESLLNKDTRRENFDSSQQKEKTVTGNRKSNLVRKNLKQVIPSLHRHHRFIHYHLNKSSIGQHKYSKNSRYLALQRRADRMNIEGKSVKLVSLTERHSNDSRSNSNETNSDNRTRKDLVIEVDDEDSNSSGAKTVERRRFDPIMSLIRSFAKIDRNDDIEIIDERGNDDNENPFVNEMDDGFISPNRRRFGQNLFLNSFVNNEDMEPPPGMEGQLQMFGPPPPNYQENYNDDEPDFQRNALPPEESYIDDNYESRIESPLIPIGESTEPSPDYETPAIYEQEVQDEPGMFGPYPNDGDNSNDAPFSNDHTLFMDVRKKKRGSVQYT